MDFKNRGEAEVFRHEDLRAQSLTYLENGGVFILQRRQSNCGFCKLFVMITSMKHFKVMNSSYI